MPHYYFSASDSVQDDDLGADLKDHSAARRFAIQYAGEIMNNQPEVLWDGREFSVAVTDESRVLLFTIRMFAENAPAGGDID